MTLVMKAMKRIDVITLFPELIESMTSYGVLSQGIKNNILEVHCHNPRSATTDRHKTVDDRPYGGGEGMVLMAEPLAKTLRNIPKIDNSKFVYMSPQGKPLNAKKAKELSSYDQLIFLCGRYEGVDERFVSQYVEEELSIGDYVLSGGELPCLVAVDSISRFYEGLLGNKGSFENDSFEDFLLKYPQFTRPVEFEGLTVPDVLLSGNHAHIKEIRRKLSILKTHFKRPDILQVSEKELSDALAFFNSLSVEEKGAFGLPNQ